VFRSSAKHGKPNFAKNLCTIGNGTCLQRGAANPPEATALLLNSIFPVPRKLSQWSALVLRSHLPPPVLKVPKPGLLGMPGGKRWGGGLSRGFQLLACHFCFAQGFSDYSASPGRNEACLEIEEALVQAEEESGSQGTWAVGDGGCLPGPVSTWLSSSTSCPQSWNHHVSIPKFIA
jgi:hypothetical protein